ncbi:hypothetical protein [uncultured Methanoculleus sp.]|uniref:hypothetical protein n=1 Tax=uncultured Methanoculleus sp. TaxID=183762 RepID=UPI003204DE20
MTHASVSTIRDNWDADAEDDGITVHPDLLDQYDETVKYSDVSIPVDIQIWTTKFDSNYKEQKDKLIYQGSGTITTWKDGNMFMKGGIKVPFSSMNVPSGEMFGWTYVTIHTRWEKLRSSRRVYCSNSLTPISYFFSNDINRVRLSSTQLLVFIIDRIAEMLSENKPYRTFYRLSRTST